MRPIARIVALVSSAVVVSATLVGCAPASACTPTIAAGSASLVSAPGALGTKPTVDFPGKLVSNDPSVATLSAGTGAVVHNGDYVDFNAVVVTGKDKSELTSTSYDAGKTERLHVKVGTNVLAESFLCQTVGSRFALAGTVEQIFGAVNGNALTPKDTVVVVFDVVNAYRGQSSGTPQIAQDGMPAVTSDPIGRPGIAMPKAAAPADLRIETLTKGDGAVVAEGQTVVAHYSAFVWGGNTFDNTWDKDHPANLVAQDFTQNNGVGVIPGFAKALIGQTVGSRVVAVIPPKDGYPTDQWPTAIPAGATLVFVIDILGIQ
ncbi:MAG: hypothetical protein RLZ72_723 [Actinomycetota bacterium]